MCLWLRGCGLGGCIGVDTCAQPGVSNALLRGREGGGGEGDSEYALEGR